MKSLAMIAAAMLVSGSAVAEDQYLTDLFNASSESDPISISVPEVGDSSTDRYLVDLFNASSESGPISHVDDQRSVSAPEIGDSSADGYLTDLFNASDES
jgi:hypothetical protein